MAWLDMSIICLLFWGGAAGYHAGWQRVSRRLGALILTAGLAVVFVGDMKAVLAAHYPVEEVIKEAIGNRMVIPVHGSPLSYQAALAELGVPGILHQPLLQELYLAAALDFNRLVDLVARVLFNVIAFSTVLFLWWGCLHLVLTIKKRQRTLKLKTTEQLAGAFAGMARACLLVSIILGVLTPITWLIGLPRELIALEEAYLGRWGLQIFHCLGVWWN